MLIGQLIGVVATNAVARKAQVPWVSVNPAFYVGPNPARPIAVDQPQVVDSFERTLLPAAAHASLVLHATDPAYDLIPVDLPTHNHYVGPLLWTRPAQTPAYVTEDGPPWALASLSTVPMAGEADLANAAVAALLEHDVRILVTGTAAHSLLTHEMARQAVYVEPFVRHDAVLERAALFVSHGGHGGVMRSMWHGVPVVLIPWGRDQDGVGYRAERLGVAKVVPRDLLSVDSVADAINAALTDPNITAASQTTAVRLAAMSPAIESARLIEEAFGWNQQPAENHPGGASQGTRYHSPLIAASTLAVPLGIGPSASLDIRSELRAWGTDPHSSRSSERAGEIGPWPGQTCQAATSSAFQGARVLGVEVPPPTRTLTSRGRMIPDRFRCGSLRMVWDVNYENETRTRRSR